MDLIKRVLWIFTSPNRVFDDIRERRVDWWQPWIVASLFYMLITWLAMPIQMAAMEVNSNMTTEQIDQQIEMMDRFGFVWIVMAPAGALLVTLVIAGLSYIAVTLAARAATFRQYFTLCFFIGIVGMMGQLVSSIIIRARGLDRIATPEDAMMALSLRPLAPDNAVVRGLLSSIEFFTIWSLVLMAMGLMRIFGMSRTQSIVVAVVLWILSAMFVIVGELFGGMGG